MGGLRFDATVATNGYLWWYADALSDDGRHGLTLIAFLGSVFSPWYARARRRGPTDPLEHCACNVALYGAGGKRWSLTERGRGDLHQQSSALAIGPSSFVWDGTTLTVRIDEVTVPFPARIRGVVRLHPTTILDETFPLDAAGRHRWRPLAPCARVEVDLEDPALRWSGRAYLDSNAGDAPLADAFERWHWSRSVLARDATAVLYDVVPRTGAPLSLALRFDPGRGPEPFAAPPVVPLPPTRWRIDRATRADAARSARVLETLEDTPFYARSLVAADLLGEATRAVHESLSLDRFRAPWVQWLLPFRAPRRAR